MEIIAHRGASHDAPENTLAAVRLAWAQGADAVEVDVHLTADGRLAVIHDPDTARTAGSAGLVRKMTLAALQRLEVGGWKAAGFHGERIPELDAVLATVPAGKRLFVEVKEGPEAVPELERCLREGTREAGQVAMIAFELETCRAAKRRLPEVEVGWLLERESVEGARPRAEILARATAAGVDGLDLEAGWLDAAWVRAGREQALRLYGWTVDKADEARRLARLGVDGITTNRPAWLRARLEAQGE